MIYFIEMKLTVTTEEEMKLLGARIGQRLSGGECVELIGDVGAGKTTFTKGIAVGLGISDTVQSPTFTINRTYDAPSGVRLSHYDFYRLSDPGIMAEELGESLEDPTVSIVIEWGDIVGMVLPDDHLRITISSPNEHTRDLTFAAAGPRSVRLIEGISL